MSIEIELSNPSNTFVAGEVLKGKVTIAVENEDKVRCECKINSRDSR